MIHEHDETLRPESTGLTEDELRRRLIACGKDRRRLQSIVARQESVINEQRVQLAALRARLEGPSFRWHMGVTRDGHSREDFGPPPLTDDPL